LSLAAGVRIWSVHTRDNPLQVHLRASTPCTASRAVDQIAVRARQGCRMVVRACVAQVWTRWRWCGRAWDRWW
jgi:hypothetical protein